MKIKRGEEREEDDDEIENKKEQEARDRLLAEEEENLESVIKEDLAIKEDEEKISNRRAAVRSFLKNRFQSRRKEKISKESSFKEDLEQKRPREASLTLEEPEEKIALKSHFSEEDLERKAEEGVDQEKEAKLKEFFGFSKKEKSSASDEERKIREKEEIQSFQEAGNEKNEIEAEEIRQELELLEGNDKRVGFFSKIWNNVSQKFSFKREREGGEEGETEGGSVEKVI